MKKIVVLLIISIFLITGCSIKKESEVTEAEIFAAKYDLPNENSFKYLNTDEVFKLFEDGSGIIIFGNPDIEYSTIMIKIFNSLIDENNIKEVYYYNPSNIIENESDEYLKLLDLLKDNLPINKLEEEYLEVPSIYFVKDGKIIGYYADKIIEDLENIDDDLVIKDLFQELITKYYINK